MRRYKLEVREFRAEDIGTFFPDGLKFSIRAWVIECDGEPAAVAGFSYQDKHAVAFSTMLDKPFPKKTILRGAKMLLTVMQEANDSFYAESDGPLLKHLGFEKIEESVYRWN